MKKNLLASIAIITLIAAAFPPKSLSAEKPCKIFGYIADTDPNGLNVRETPAKDGKIVKRLIRGSGDISLDIIASAGNGWVKITNAWNGDTDEEFKGTGWVFATLLATGTKGSPNYGSPANLYSTPNKKSKVLMQIPSEDEVTIVDCSGSWAKVSYKGTTGWLAGENQCGSPFTTCS